MLGLPLDPSFDPYFIYAHIQCPTKRYRRLKAAFGLREMFSQPGRVQSKQLVRMRRDLHHLQQLSHSPGKRQQSLSSLATPETRCSEMFQKQVEMELRGTNQGQMVVWDLFPFLATSGLGTP